MMPPKDTRALGMTRLEPWDLIMKKQQVLGMSMGCPLYLMDRQM